MNEQQFLAFTDRYVAFLKDEIAHVTRELNELEEYKSGKRKSKHPLGSKFFANVGDRLTMLVWEMERWGQSGN